MRPLSSVIRHHHATIAINACTLLMLLGCRETKEALSEKTLWERAEQQRRLFGDFELPRKLGRVENVGLQIPAVSPDGQQMLYLQTDHEILSLMTLLGSPDSRHTPPEGSLSIWLRPVAGASPGRQLSTQRWAHSAVWSDSGQAVAYVVNEPPVSYIVYINLTGGQSHMLGVPNALNCLVRFNGDDRTLLFCAADGVDKPFRVYRQTVGESQPVALTPEGVDCLFPIVADDHGNVLCARVEGDQLNWCKCGPQGITDIARGCGTSQRPTLLQMWAGIESPLSPDRKNVLFYDTMLNRLGVCHLTEQVVRRHRPGSITACWVDDETISLATQDGAFIINTTTGVSISLLDGSWIPCRYVPTTRRLILLGKEGNHMRDFSIWEIVFKTR